MRAGAQQQQSEYATPALDFDLPREATRRKRYPIENCRRDAARVDGHAAGIGASRGHHVYCSPMKRLATCVAIAIAIVALPLSAATRGGENAPAFTLTDLSGHSISLADLNGNIVVMHFAASW